MTCDCERENGTASAPVNVCTLVEFEDATKNVVLYQCPECKTIWVD